MSYQDDFELWKDQIENLPESQVKLPKQPVDEFVASSETLAVEAAEDRDALAGAGMDLTIIDDVPPLSGALRHCQALWMSEYRARQEVQKQWNEQSPLAYELRDRLLHDFSFAYRNDDDINKKVMRIREGGSHSDMVQDLVELATLGEKYPEQLTAINFNLTRLDQARTLSETMADLLAAANGSNDETNATKLQRDKAYTLLANKVSTIREYGRYVFWKDDDKRARYYKD
ncbi:hypothetical protein [uncultured Sunxiuqinia sp.]|uniref:hypothetical protein n=1 Tax=uncultured Sunxiuqinia sp. TaxID=1573825 RepID=UPI002AA801CA|nr:hypothetical protein [uncultured Sunxiuqinia sp.]